MSVTITGEKTEKNIQSVSRAVNIIEFIAGNANMASLTFISQGLGLSKSTTHGLISTLEQRGYVQQDPVTGKYTLGLKLFELGNVVYSSLDIRSIAVPYMQHLVKKIEETAHLAVLSQGEVVYIEKVDSPQSVRIATQIGSRNPIHCTGVGKALMAGLSETEIDRILKGKVLKPHTDNTITCPEQFKQHLKEVTKLGYAMDLEEIELGLSCVAAPVKNHIGRTVAAVSISGPSYRLSKTKLEEFAADVMSTAKEISLQLGHRA